MRTRIYFYIAMGRQFPLVLLAALAMIGVVRSAVAEPLLPDLIAWANQSAMSARCYMYCGAIDTELIDSKVLYRFNGALPNIGVGPLEVREVTHPDNTQDVYQRIYQSDGGLSEVMIGSFPGAASIPPRHLWLPGIAQYNLRMVTEGNGVGPVVSSHDKISMAVVDSLDYDRSLPGAPQSRVYRDVSAPNLGISIGWADVYPRDLPGQWVEATGLPDGQYWLEVIADPYNRIQERDETNNTTRILVSLVVPDAKILPGDYNDDGQVEATDYVVWRDVLGKTVAELGTGADGDGSGIVDAADYDVWRANFGNISVHTSAHAAAIPEPPSLISGWLALCIGLLFHFPRRPSR